MIGGSTPRPNIAGGMDQLDSPVHSARQIADWFITKFNNPHRPLGTVEMLLSCDGNQSYTRPDGTEFDVDLAELDNIVTGGLEWRDRGDANPEDMLVFFFSGHGIASGSRVVLLPRDYGTLAARPLRKAIDFTAMVEGMKCCKAGLQLYFVDACRVASEVLLQQATDTGDVIVPTSIPVNKSWQGSVYYASLGGRPAFGQDGDASLFTKALIKSLKGPAASDAEGPNDWRITTTKLSEALGHFATAMADPIYGPAQKPQTGSQTLFDFHYMTDVPIVPIYVQPSWHQGAQPPADAQRFSVSLYGMPVVEWGAPWHHNEQCNWGPDRFESWIEPGHQYTVNLSFNEGDPVSAMSRHVNPVYTVFKLDRNDG